MTKQHVGLRRSDVSEQVPSENDVGLGELAFNTAEGKIYFKKLDGTVVELTDKFTKDEIEVMLLERDVTLSFDFLNENYEVAKIATLTTDDIAEGASGEALYFTQQRARDSINVSGDLDYTNGVISFNETYSTPEEVKQAYESNANTNVFSDDDKNKLDAVNNMANRDVFIENSAPSSSDGNDGDIWFQF